MTRYYHGKIEALQTDYEGIYHGSNVKYEYKYRVVDANANFNIQKEGNPYYTGWIDVPPYKFMKNDALMVISYEKREVEDKDEL